MSDGIVDLRNVLVLDQVLSKYGIRKEDEVLAQGMTLAEAIGILSSSERRVGHDVMNVCA